MTIAVVCHPLSVALHCVASLHFSQYDHQQRWRRQRRRHPNLYIITAPGRGKLPIKTYSILFIFRGLLLCLPGTLNKSLSVALLCDDCVVGGCGRWWLWANRLYHYRNATRFLVASIESVKITQFGVSFHLRPFSGFNCCPQVTKINIDNNSKVANCSSSTPFSVCCRLAQKSTNSICHLLYVHALIPQLNARTISVIHLRFSLPIQFSQDKTR